MMADPPRSGPEKGPLSVPMCRADVSPGRSKSLASAGQVAAATVPPVRTNPHRDPEGRLSMSINELDTTEPGSSDVVVDLVLDDEVLDSLAPAIPAADV